MSNNHKDQPAAGHNPHAIYDRGQGDRIKPIDGEIIVRTGKGSALLTQTLALFKGNKNK
jgi:hypothetical protein